MIYASKNEAVCLEIQMHFESSLPASFTKKLWAQFHDFVLKNEVVCCEIQAHFGVFALRVLWKIFRAHYHVLCVQKINCRDVQTHFGSSPPPKFTEKVLDKFSQMMCPQTKLFAMKFRRILQVSAWKNDKNVVGAFSRFMCRVNKHSWLQHFLKMLWPRFIIFHAHNLCWIVRAHCKVLDFHIL